MWKVYAVLAVAIAVALFTLGDLHRGRVDEQQRDQERLSDAAALAAHNAQMAQEAKDYEAQISAANTARNNANAELSRLAGLPHSRVLCKRSANSGSAVPADPATPRTATAGDRQLSEGVEFDPTDLLYAEARRADSTVEACRDLYNRWPQQ